MHRKIAILDSYVPDFDNLPEEMRKRCGSVESVEISMLKKGRKRIIDHGSVVFYELSTALSDFTVYCLEILDGSNYTEPKVMIKALKWCLDHDLDLVHTSTGVDRAHYRETRTLKRLSRKLRDKGVMLTAAAGNAALARKGTSSVLLPAALPEWVAFGSSQDGKRSVWSSTGSEVLFTLDGEDEKSWGILGEKMWSGTSLAAPRGAAVMLSVASELETFAKPVRDVQEAVLTVLPFLALHPLSLGERGILYRNEEFGHGSLQPYFDRLKAKKESYDKEK